MGSIMIGCTNLKFAKSTRSLHRNEVRFGHAIAICRNLESGTPLLAGRRRVSSWEEYASPTSSGSALFMEGISNPLFSSCLRSGWRSKSLKISFGRDTVSLTSAVIATDLREAHRSMMLFRTNTVDSVFFFFLFIVRILLVIVVKVKESTQRSGEVTLLTTFSIKSDVPTIPSTLRLGNKLDINGLLSETGEPTTLVAINVPVPQLSEALVRNPELLEMGGSIGDECGCLSKIEELTMLGFPNPKLSTGLRNVAVEVLGVGSSIGDGCGCFSETGEPTTLLVPGCPLSTGPLPNPNPLEEVG